MKTDPSAIRETTPRADVQIRLPDDRTFAAERGMSLTQILRAAYPTDENPPVAAIVDGKLRELNQPVERDLDIKPVFLSDSDGIRIYSRSLSFLLVAAFHELFPNARVIIDYSVPQGGYYCRVEGRPQLSTDELGRVKERMTQLVREDRSIERERVSVDEAREIFRARGEDGKVRLFDELDDDHVHLYMLNGVADYFYGYMVPSTGILRTFALEPFSAGFILRFPRRDAPSKLLPSQRFTALREVFDEYGEWLDLLGMRDVGSLNEAIRENRIEQIILVSEALHEKRITEIAAQLSELHRSGTRLAVIAGPSASGKTTFSKRLAIQLLASGIHPYPLAMDDYFCPRAELFKRFGEDVDFDSPDALDLSLLHEDLHRLVRGEPVELPRYNFHTGLREKGDTAKLEPNQILLVEGIHGLIPEFLDDIPAKACFRIFVSALTQLNLDCHNRVSTTDTRLIRRIVRDATYRGYSAEGTLQLWDDVRRGEKRHIFPHQEEANVLFNSALSYELAVLKPLVEPKLLQVQDPMLRIEAERLLSLLRWFEPQVARNIPDNSILREFIGGSILRDFMPMRALNGARLELTERVSHEGAV